jgi:NADH dehydrogenase (ubiquinone) flavoprotein 2
MFLTKVARSTLQRSRSFVTSSRVTMSDQFNKHRHTPDNNDDTPFEFTEENMRKVETVLGKYPDNYKQR